MNYGKWCDKYAGAGALLRGDSLQGNNTAWSVGCVGKKGFVGDFSERTWGVEKKGYLLNPTKTTPFQSFFFFFNLTRVFS
jgi:hypothetical protein